MIIGIDAGCLGVSDNRLKVGVYRMAKALLESIGKIDHKNVYKLYSFKPIEKKLLEEFGSNFHNIIVRPAKGWFNIWLPLELRRKPVDVLLGLSQSLPRLPKKTKSIVFVHDLTFEKYPQWFPTYSKMSANSKKAVSRADIVIAVSQSTQNDLINLYHTPGKKITVIHESLDRRLTKITAVQARNRLKKSGIRNPFLLFVGTYKQNKNIPNIITAFAKIKRLDYNLILAGSDLWLDQSIKETIHNLKLRKRIKLLGFVSDFLLEALYTQAKIFISPSFNEGFGLTFLEAVHFELPIVCSDKGSVKEILGEGAALYVNPDSPADIALGIEKILSDTALGKRLISKALQHTGQFSWDKSARQLLTIIQNYEKV